MKRDNRFIRSLCATMLVLLLQTSIRADDPQPNKLNAEEKAQGWILLFDGESALKWQIDGDHEIEDGTLILGGEQTTRAYFPMQVQRGFELRFQYRTEGKEGAGVGWDCRRKGGGFIPGVPLPILTPKRDWHDAYLEEYFDIQRPFQRFIRHGYGANGIFAQIESVWVEVPAGNKLFLRNVRLRSRRPVQWHWVLAAPLVLAGVMSVIVWRWKRRQRKESTQEQHSDSLKS